MSIDSIIGYIIVPLIFLWLGIRVYGHEKEPIDKLIDKIKGLFKGDDEVEERSMVTTGEYNINYGQ
ncbi:hypothetical protein LCGC14_0996430 [marine sediment metagenome]|uniref:Uncharacterized protein n=1 Tax=marine sediment metagenome TaxID=412755 RepID=A0A0F9RAH5_9ZZZZ